MAYTIVVSANYRSTIHYSMFVCRFKSCVHPRENNPVRLRVRCVVNTTKICMQKTSSCWTYVLVLLLTN